MNVYDVRMTDDILLQQSSRLDTAHTSSPLAAAPCNMTATAQGKLVCAVDQHDPTAGAGP